MKKARERKGERGGEREVRGGETETERKTDYEDGEKEKERDRQIDRLRRWREITRMERERLQR